MTKLHRRSWVRCTLACCSTGLLSESALAKTKKKLGAGRGLHNHPEPKFRRRFRRYDREPRILFFTSDQSEKSLSQLERLKQGGDFGILQRRGWEIGPTANKHIQVIRAEERPDLVHRFSVTFYPWLGCLESGQIVRSFTEGCSTPLDHWTLYWMLTGENHRPDEPLSEEITVQWTGHYPLRGGHWSINDDDHPILERVVRHLRDTNHANRYPSKWSIEQWSYEELRSLHDDIHERGHPRALLKESVSVVS